MKRRHVARGFTLMELLIAIGVLAMISTLIYGAFASMRTSKEGVGRFNDRLHEGRSAIQRMARELQSAYLSHHRPIDPNFIVRLTAFIGDRGSPADTLHFNSFSHRRYDRDSHVSDQCELSYFAAESRDERGRWDLLRRIDVSPDLEPDRGGRVDVLATDIDLLELEYLDPVTGMWAETWDSTQTIGQPDRLPLQVRITLVLNDGRRANKGRARGTLRFSTKVSIPIQKPLSFGSQG
jgi:general secretion pathway protein J